MMSNQKSKIPQRSCIACKEVRRKDELLRFVLSPDGELVTDLLNKVGGRGSYTCISRRCVSEAVSKNKFSKALRAPVRVGSVDEMIGVVMGRIHDRFASFLALANKAGKVVSGTDMVLQRIKSIRRSTVLFIACDISEEIGKKAMAVAKVNDVEYFSMLSKETMGTILGKSDRSLASIEGDGFVDAIKREIGRYRNFVWEGLN